MNNIIIVPTGNIIKEYLECREISQKEFALRTNTSEKHVSNLLKGKTRLTEEFALKIEKIMPDVSASYWLNYETKYREYIARNKEMMDLEKEDLTTISKKFHFDAYFDKQGNLVDEAIEMLKLLKISSFSAFNNVYSSNNIYYLEDSGDIESIAIWLNICKNSIESCNKELTGKFDLKDFKNSFELLKNILNNDDIESLIGSIRRFLNMNNIYFVYMDAFEASRIRGALTTYNNNPVIFLSSRFKRVSNLIFALLHEIGHLVLHYQSKSFVTYVSVEDEIEKNIEAEASKFASDFIIDPANYSTFVKENDFSLHNIKNFSYKNNVLVGLVIARLQYDKYLPYELYSNLK